MKKNVHVIISVWCILLMVGCSSKKALPPAYLAATNHPDASLISDDALLDSVQRRTFDYFWTGAEPVSGMARERYHVDGVYPENDKEVVTSGGSGFGIMAIVAGIDRGYITRKSGFERLSKIVSFLEKSDSFHGVFPHWWYGDTGKVKGFSRNDNGGDLVETSFLMQGLLVAHQYYMNGSPGEKALAARIDKLWKAVQWSWHTNGENVLFWHWSPEHSWEMNFRIRGFNECLIAYVLAASSPTFGVSAEVYHEGWGDKGKLIEPHQMEGYGLNMHYQSVSGAGPLFWAHYSFLGLDPNGLKDRYADYFQEMKNYTLVNRAYCLRNPKGFKGYGENSWGLTASYSVNGYSAHEPHESNDLGVVSPTAALSSIVYTPDESQKVIRYLYTNLRSEMWGKFGFYDAYSETAGWFPQRYLAIDQGPIVVMIENYRSKLIWKLFMSHPDVQNGLRKLGFESPYLSK
jgi:hypothetical protein